MNPNSAQQYSQASVATANNLKTMAQSLMTQELSRLTLPEIEEAVDIVAKMVPAGNVPGVILNGLARISGRSPSQQNIKRDINLLFKGVEQVLDRAAYSAFFAGPAAVIWGYQNLLKLAGKQPEDAFPQGTWQFYVDYALREDTARHTNETHGFDTILNAHGVKLSQIDRITALAMSCIGVLTEYPTLLENEWRERVYLHLIDTFTQGRLSKAYGQWEKQRPYARRADAGNLTYAQYRRAKFDEFIQSVLQSLSAIELEQWRKAVAEQERTHLPAYQQQMSIISYLKPESHSEEHVDLPLKEIFIGLIHQGAYYLIPVWVPTRNTVMDVMTVRGSVAAVLGGSVQAPAANLVQIASVQRSTLTGVERQFSETVKNAWAALRCAPILINADSRPRHLPLAQIRQTERGIGDHALTIFDTGETFAFDQSHIYFDGSWGAALAEIITNEALSWARYLATLPAAHAETRHIRPVNFTLQPADQRIIDHLPRISVESAAESDKINIKAIIGVRKLFKQRSDLLNLTVNDLLVLYRAIHAVTYQPSADLIAQIEASKLGKPILHDVLQSINDQSNPSILIPIDASRSAPSERLYPMSFDVPLSELDLITLHKHTMASLDGYRIEDGEGSSHYMRFDTLQREYLATLAGFGAVLSRAKEIAAAGEGASTGSIRLLAHMPRPLQRLLDEIPSKIDLLNDIIKGREVFSNVGAVAPSSTLTRFITAKDDNKKKTLAWGVITDAGGVMRISLRDFRPHVALLGQANLPDLAQRITQEYLDAYVNGLNRFIGDLRRITVASRETRMIKDFKYDE